MRFDTKPNAVGKVRSSSNSIYFIFIADLQQGTLRSIMAGKSNGLKGGF